MLYCLYSKMAPFIEEKKHLWLSKYNVQDISWFLLLKSTLRFITFTLLDYSKNHF